MQVDIQHNKELSVIQFINVLFSSGDLEFEDCFSSCSVALSC